MARTNKSPHHTRRLPGRKERDSAAITVANCWVAAVRASVEWSVSARSAGCAVIFPFQIRTLDRHGSQLAQQFPRILVSLGGFFGQHAVHDAT